MKLSDHDTILSILILVLKFFRGKITNFLSKSNSIAFEFCPFIQLTIFKVNKNHNNKNKRFTLLIIEKYQVKTLTRFGRIYR